MIGSSIAHYRVTAKIGEGGMGEVYRASDDRLNREVAIKLLPGAVEQDPERLARFRREAQMLAALSHGNIAAVYGLEEEGGRVAIVLELVEGEELSERIARGPLPFDDAREIALQIATAFEVAHEKGIIHRDLKPANVKITPDGTVKVLDFGLAKALGPETASGDGAHPTTSPTVTSAQTRDGVILGTAAYMSPEQARGRPVDRRADIWAFGCVLYEMLGGKTAFARETVSDTLVVILSGEADWDALPPSTPPAVVRLLKRCLEKDPRRRLRDIGEARVLLEDAAPGGAEAEPAADVIAAARPDSAARPWVVAAITAAVAVAAFAAGWLLRTPNAEPNTIAADLSIRRLTFEAGLEQEPSLSPDGNYVVYTTNRDGNLDLELLPLSGGAVNRLTSDPADDAQASWSPDGTRLAFVSAREREKSMLVSSGGLGADSNYVYSEGGDIFIMPALGGAATKLIDRGAYPTWSPDGSAIAFQSNRDGHWRLWRIPSTGGEPQLVTESGGVNRYEFHPSWSPDGLWLAYGIRYPRGGNTLRVVPAAGGEPIDIYDGPIVTPAWSHDGAYVYFASSRTGSEGVHNLWRIPFDPEAEVAQRPERVTLGAEADVGASISADGRRIVFSQVDFRPQLWSLDMASRELTRVADSPSTEDAPHLHPDGRRLLFQSDRGGDTRVWVRDLVSGELRVLATPSEASLARWSPDGTRIAYSNSTDDADGVQRVAIQRWGETTREVMQGPGSSASTGLQWAPDGERLVGSEGTSASAIWIHTPGGESRLLIENGTFGTWSPDGERIAYQRDTGRDHRELWVVPAAGGEPGMIVGGEVHLSHPQWHPADPELILVVIDHLDLGVVHVSSGTLERITELASSTIQVDYASWSPDGRTVYFSLANRTGDLYLLER